MARPRLSPAARVAIQSKLRHDKQSSACVSDGKVHFAVLVVENAEVNDLFREPDDLLFGIGTADTQKHQNSGSDPPRNLFANSDFRPLYALKDGPHPST